MILAARKCGCAIQEKEEISQTSFNQSCSSNLNPYPSKSCFSDNGSDDSSCGCGDDNEADDEETRVVSEIEKKGLPYKEIEAIINNNRMIVRIQKEPAKEEFEPPCDCIEPQQTDSEDMRAQFERRSDIVLQKASEGCRTISVYPNPDKKKQDAHSSISDEPGRKNKSKRSDKQTVELPTVNPEENPNIFVLKIRRKCENGDKKHNLDLEFKTPRPWRETNECKK